MDLITIVLIVTPIVLGVIFFTVVIPPTRKKLAERRAAERATDGATQKADPPRPGD